MAVSAKPGVKIDVNLLLIPSRGTLVNNDVMSKLTRISQLES